jgi:hypothetical protein
VGLAVRGTSQIDGQKEKIEDLSLVNKLQLKAKKVVVRAVLWAILLTVATYIFPL